MIGGWGEASSSSGLGYKSRGASAPSQRTYHNIVRMNPIFVPFLYGCGTTKPYFLDQFQLASNELFGVVQTKCRSLDIDLKY